MQVMPGVSLRARWDATLVATRECDETMQITSHIPYYVIRVHTRGNILHSRTLNSVRQIIDK